MAGKFFGPVGYGHQVEEPADSGVWQEVVTEYPYYGEIGKATRRFEEGEKVNSNLTLGNTISILADPFAIANYHAMLYVKWDGVLWEVTSVENLRPRLLLRLGGVYHGRTPSIPSDT